MPGQTARSQRRKGPHNAGLFFGQTTDKRSIYSVTTVLLEDVVIEFDELMVHFVDDPMC
jgi:hypothetical protein